MLSKQTLIHIATDVVLISILFMYVNNKHRASVSAIDELREYTEEQIDNINKKLDTLVRYVTKQKQRPIQQPQYHPQYQSQQQSQFEQRQFEQSQFEQRQFEQRQPQQRQQPQYHPQQEEQEPQRKAETRQPQKKVRFDEQQNLQEMKEVDEFVNTIPQNISFVATSFVQTAPKLQPQAAAKIEVVEDEGEDNELNDMDMMEIEKALQAEEDQDEGNNDEL